MCGTAPDRHIEFTYLILLHTNRKKLTIFFHLFFLSSQGLALFFFLPLTFPVSSLAPHIIFFRVDSFEGLSLVRTVT